MKGKIKESWGELTDNDVALYDGKREQFLGKLQENYGLAKQDVLPPYNRSILRETEFSVFSVMGT